MGQAVGVGDRRITSRCNLVCFKTGKSYDRCIVCVTSNSNVSSRTASNAGMDRFSHMKQS